MGVYLLHAHVSKQAARFAPRNHANCDDLCTRTGRERFSLVRSFVNVRVIGSLCSFADSEWTNFAWNEGGRGRTTMGRLERSISNFFIVISWDGSSIIGELIGGWIYLEKWREFVFFVNGNIFLWIYFFKADVYVGKYRE